MKPGNCINIPAEVKHWHGTVPNEWFSHLAIEVPGAETSNEWCKCLSKHLNPTSERVRQDAFIKNQSSKAIRLFEIRK
jgi:hypothetical protein